MRTDDGDARQASAGMPANRAPSATLTPIAPGGRIVALDALRGLALLGILATNIQSFIGPHSSGGWRAVDRVLLFFVSWLIEGKFVAMFSLLFGVGVALQLRRARERGADSVTPLRRRFVVLAGFGLLHGIGVWSGDVLLPYAVGGFVLLALRRRTVRTVRRWAVGMWVASSAAMLLVAGLVSASDRGQAVVDAGALAAYTSGSYPTMVLRRAFETAVQTASAPVLLPWVVALMLVGVLAVRGGIVTDPHAAWDRLGKISRIGLTVGLPLAAVGAAVEIAGDAQTAGLELMSGALLTAAAPILALGYLATAGRWLLRHPGAVTDRLAAVGRMALTNYLLQSVLASAWAYTGRYGSTTLAAGLGFWVLISVLQLLWSPWWLARFRQGPAEALWRRLTYRAGGGAATTGGAPSPPGVDAAAGSSGPRQ